MPLEKYLRGSVWWVKGRAADGDEYLRKSLGTSDEAIAEAGIREAESRARKRRILGPDAPKPEDELTFAAAVLLYPASARDAAYLKALVKREGKDARQGNDANLYPATRPEDDGGRFDRHMASPDRHADSQRN